MKHKLKALAVSVMVAISLPAFAKVQIPMDTLTFCDHPRKVVFVSNQSAGNLYLKIKSDTAKGDGKSTNKPGKDGGKGRGKNDKPATASRGLNFESLERQTGSKLLGAAQGPVLIPPNSFVTLKLGRNFFLKPDLLSKLPPDSIDCLEVSMLSMDDNEDTLCDDALGHLDNLTGLQAIILDRSDATDVGLKRLAKLTNLAYISAFLTNINGNSFKDLSNLKKLKYLSFHSTPLHGNTLSALANFSQLQILDLTRTGIDSSAAMVVGKLLKLRQLDISDNPRINDTVIPMIARLKDLDNLNLSNTSITYNGMKGLKGLNPRMISMPGNISASQLKDLQSIFPETQLYVQSTASKKVDDETGTIFGAVSRGRIK